MCGIMGYVGNRSASDLLISGLRRLEYRGYDSAGIATLDDGRLQLRRTTGRVDRLASHLEQEPASGTVGIAHTRWATHGRPTVQNAHPHVDATGKISIVHNGVIENHSSIRVFLEQQGVTFASETDTEALAQLIGFFYEQTGDLAASLRRALCDVHGTFGLAVMCADLPRTLFAARRGSPLIIGIGSDEYYISSDASAIVPYTTQATYLNDNEMVSIGSEGLRATTIDAVPVEKSFDTLEFTLDAIELAHFEHHMLKEIYEQPESLRNTMRGRLNPRTGELSLGGISKCERDITHCQRVLLFGCGSACHAGLIGEYLFEELAGIPAEVDCASELRYRNPIIEESTLGIAISQSGETADTLAALREVRMKGALVLGVVNSVGSTIARETDAGIYLHAGPEIGVASTKAFTCQVAVLAMMAVYVGRRRRLSYERTFDVLSELERIPEKIEIALELNDQVRQLAERLADWDNWLYLGRGINSAVALEGALKLKETSYIHAEGLPAAEMKHGPIALINEGMPVIVIATRDHTYGKIIGNIEEVRSRGGRVIALATEGDDEITRVADEVLYVPATLPILSPLVNSIPLQLLAYHTANTRGHDVDKPRNLAKSVTVE